MRATTKTVAPEDILSSDVDVIQFENDLMRQLKGASTSVPGMSVQIQRVVVTLQPHADYRRDKRAYHKIAVSEPEEWQANFGDDSNTKFFRLPEELFRSGTLEREAVNFEKLLALLGLRTASIWTSG